MQCLGAPYPFDTFGVALKFVALQSEAGVLTASFMLVEE